MARPKSSKQKFHIALESHVQEMLKGLAARNACSVGDVVDGLLRCVDGLPVRFPVSNDTARNYLNSCISDAANSGGSVPNSVFIVDDLEIHRSYLFQAYRLASLAGDKKTAALMRKKFIEMDWLKKRKSISKGNKV